jgi:hypothetical protein
VHREPSRRASSGRCACYHFAVSPDPASKEDKMPFRIYFRIAFLLLFLFPCLCLAGGGR